jgi:hypothetical protein
MRANFGQLWMTPFIDCQQSHPFSILQALYYVSALVHFDGHLVETDEQGNPVKIPLANSKHPEAAPEVPGPPPPKPVLQQFDYSQSSTWTQHYVLNSCHIPYEILLEPWKRENACGGKCFHATLFPSKTPVIVKLWDSYQVPSTDRDAETEIYMTLQSLWGTVIPRLILSADVDYCWGIVLEEIKVSDVYFCLTAAGFTIIGRIVESQS